MKHKNIYQKWWKGWWVWSLYLSDSSHPKIPRNASWNIKTVAARIYLDVVLCVSCVLWTNRISTNNFTKSASVLILSRVGGTPPCISFDCLKNQWATVFSNIMSLDTEVKIWLIIVWILCVSYPHWNMRGFIGLLLLAIVFTVLFFLQWHCRILLSSSNL